MCLNGFICKCIEINSTFYTQFATEHIIKPAVMPWYLMVFLSLPIKEKEFLLHVQSHLSPKCGPWCPPPSPPPPSMSGATRPSKAGTILDGH